MSENFRSFRSEQITRHSYVACRPSRAFLKGGHSRKQLKRKINMFSKRVLIKFRGPLEGSKLDKYPRKDL